MIVGTGAMTAGTGASSISRPFGVAQAATPIPDPSLEPVPAWVRSLPRHPGTPCQDAVGVPGAIVRVPDGMASAVLVGANPVYGVYASMATDGRATLG
jgi:hypothetical protein